MWSVRERKIKCPLKKQWLSKGDLDSEGRSRKVNPNSDKAGIGGSTRNRPA